MTRIAPGHGERRRTRGRRALGGVTFPVASRMSAEWHTLAVGSDDADMASDVELRTIETEDPGADGPAAVVAVALARRDRARARSGSSTGSRSRSSARSPAALTRRAAARAHGDPDRPRGRDLRRRRVSRARSFFGYLTDRFGRKKLFLVTLGALPRRDRRDGLLARPSCMFAICRFFTGAGIGGEYAAINSAIDELIPARVRGTVDLAINGTLLARHGGRRALRSLVLLNASIFAADVGWRIAFGLGAVLAARDPARPPQRAREPALAHDPRPRRRGRATSSRDIEHQVGRETGEALDEPRRRRSSVRQRRAIGFGTIARTVFGIYPRRTVARPRR